MKHIFKYILVIAALVCIQGGLAKSKTPAPQIAFFELPSDQYPVVKANGFYYAIDVENSTAMAVDAPSRKKKINYPEHVTFPDSIPYKHKKYALRTIYWDAIEMNSTVQRITIPNTVRSAFFNEAFINCKELSYPVYNDSIFFYMPSKFADANPDFPIPNGIHKIDNYAFQSSHIQSITIPSSVTDIGLEAFMHSALKQITIFCEKIPVLFVSGDEEPGYNIVPNPQEVILYVPFNCVEVYKNHPEWNKFDIRPIPPVNDIMLI